MIRRAAQLVAALGGAAESEMELTTVAAALRGSGAELGAIADLVIDAIEENATASTRRNASWAPATALGACFAAVGGALGLHAITRALLAGGSYSWIWPLVALPIALFALFSAIIETRLRRADQRERVAVSIALALPKIGVPHPLALETGIAVSALDHDRARHLSGIAGDESSMPMLALRKSSLLREGARVPVTQRIAPGVAAVWAVACFWILYFGTVGLSMAGGLVE